jgi:L-fuculose-phosphate aldolase
MSLDEQNSVQAIARDIARFGKKLVSSGLTSSRFGNISARSGSKIVITCTGTMLDELENDQIVEVDLTRTCDLDKMASSETCVHRRVYQNTAAKAIIHTHSPFAVSMSLLENSVVKPIDSEGTIFLGDMPIVDGHFGTDELARNVSTALVSHKACIARGHGVFAAGKNLVEAYTAASMAEHSAQVKYLVDAYRNNECGWAQKRLGKDGNS